MVKMFEKVCPNCGARLSYFIKTGMLGCPSCYVAFENEINSVAKKMHGRTIHVGKELKIVGEDRELLTEYESLQLQKERAAIDRDFETMAKLSEEILELKEILVNRGLL